MAGITGIGSGMDIDAMVKAISTAEQAPKASQLKRVEAKATTQLTSLGQLKGAISNFQTALSTLNSPSSFLARKATSSDTAVVSATASQSAVAGSYKIEVEKLASDSKVALAAINSDPETKLNTGTLSIKVGDTVLADITVDSTNNTLAGVRDAINKAGASTGVSATIINDDQGSRLVLSSSKTGDGNDITVSAVNADPTEMNLITVQRSSLMWLIMLMKTTRPTSMLKLHTTHGWQMRVQAKRWPSRKAQSLQSTGFRLRATVTASMMW